VLPDLPLDEDEETAEEGEPGELREFLRRFFAPAPETRSLGSGFVVESSGYIVTNAHLIGDGTEIRVRLADRREYEARLVGADAASDIALVKIEADGLPVARLGDPAKLRPGEWVAAIGAPFGLERSVTAGIVSALRRTLPEESFVPFIQTDVAVNPGNSGGPLFNLRGEVVGVNSVIYSDTGGYMGLSFAIPIDVAMEVASQLRAQGKVVRGRIGVRLQEIGTELARALKLPRPGGALIVEVFQGGPADRAALRPGDVVLAFGGKPVESDADLVRLTARAQPGSVVEAELWRFGRRFTARLGVDEAKGAGPMPAALPQKELLGLQLAPRKGGGVRVERARDAAQRAGLLRGDIIHSVNGQPVSTPREAHAALAAAGAGATVALLVQRDAARQFLPLRLPR
jgi:serine protease Do